MTDSVTRKNGLGMRWKVWAAVGAVTWLNGCGEGAPNADDEEANGVMITESISGEGGGGEGGGGEGEGGEGEGGEGEGGEGEGGEGEGGEGEGGEGEGGEGEGEGAEASVDFATDDVAYLTQLGLIRGHLKVGYTLYLAGQAAMSGTHMKHPEAEIYSTLLGAFETRECNGFATELAGLATAVASAESDAAVTAAYSALDVGINRCEDVVDASPATLVGVIEQLIRVAGEEYQIGVVNGAIDNLHEYQDAWGFTQIASELASNAAFDQSDESKALALQLQVTIDKLAKLWPSIDAPGQLDTSAAELYGAAAEIEIMSLRLKK
ncbi:MAG: hypothetical protein AAF387_06690 [Pseudomonadota bacterium]